MAGLQTHYSFCYNFFLINKDKLDGRALIKDNNTFTSISTAS